MYPLLDNVFETWQCRPRRRVQRSLIAASLGETVRGHPGRGRLKPLFPAAVGESGGGWMDALMSQHVVCGVLEEVHAVVTVLEASCRTIQPSRCRQLVHPPETARDQRWWPLRGRLLKRSKWYPLPPCMYVVVCDGRGQCGQRWWRAGVSDRQTSSPHSLTNRQPW